MGNRHHVDNVFRHNFGSYLFACDDGDIPSIRSFETFKKVKAYRREELGIEADNRSTVVVF